MTLLHDQDFRVRFSVRVRLQEKALNCKTSCKGAQHFQIGSCPECLSPSAKQEEYQEPRDSFYEESCCILMLPYSLIFSKDVKTKCGCPSDIGGRCNHVAATLFSMNKCCKEREKRTSESCTCT